VKGNDYTTQGLIGRWLFCRIESGFVGPVDLCVWIHFNRLPFKCEIVDIHVLDRVACPGGGRRLRDEWIYCGAHLAWTTIRRDEAEAVAKIPDKVSRFGHNMTAFIMLRVRTMAWHDHAKSVDWLGLSDTTITRGDLLVRRG
jgi:hypothetical protein